MGRPDRRISSGLTQSHAATARVSRFCRHRRRLSEQRSRFRCVAASPYSSPNSTSGGLVVGCLYRKVDVRSRCTSIRVVKNSSGCVIDHVVDVNYVRSVSVDVDRRQHQDTSSDTSQSSSPTHDVTESITSYTVSYMKPLPVDSETGSCDDVILSSASNSSKSSPTHFVSECKTPHQISIDNETGTGSRRHVELSLIHI